MNGDMIYFILLPAAAALLCPFIAAAGPRVPDRIANLVLAAGLAMALYTLPYYEKLRIYNLVAYLPVKGFLGSDTLSSIMLIIIYGIGLAASLYSSMSVREKLRRNLYSALFLLTIAALSGAAMTNDFFTLYLFTEAAWAAAYSLVAFPNRSENTEGAFKCLLISAIGSALMLFGLALLMLSAGGTGFPSLAALAAANSPAMPVVAGFMICGFMIKAGTFPFHPAATDALEAAPPHTSAFLSSVMVKTVGLYGVIRTILIIKSFPCTGLENIQSGMLAMGLLSILAGALAAISQNDIRRMAAYAGLSQSGYILIAAAAGTPLAITGAIFHLFNSAITSSALYLNAASIEKSAGSTRVDRLNGLAVSMPWTTRALSSALMSSAGMPPLAGFWSKALILAALWSAGARWTAAMAAFMSLILMAGFIELQRRSFHSNIRQTSYMAQEVKPQLLSPALAMAALILCIGLYFPFLYVALVDPSARIMP